MAFQKMRTAGREVIDPVEIERFLLSNHIIRVGLYDEDEGYPYIVPLNYGFEYDAEDGKLIFYMHCAKTGRKLNLIQKNGCVCFEIDSYWGLRQTELACQWGMNFDSMIGHGKIFILLDEDGVEKKHGLDAIMRQHGRYHELNYAQIPYQNTTVLRLEVEGFTVKRYRDRTLPQGRAHGE